MLTENIKEGLKDKFNIEFLRSKIIFCMHDLWHDRLVGNKFILDVPEEHEFSEVKTIAFSAEDDLTVLNFVVTYDLFMGFWYRVEVGVGQITERKVREPYVEKFKFMIRFNDDYSCIDCEYYYTKSVPPTSHHVK